MNMPIPILISAGMPGMATDTIISISTALLVK